MSVDTSLLPGSTSALASRPSGAAPWTAGACGPSDLVAWAERTALRGIGGSVSELIVRLEQILATDLTLDTRYRILRALKAPLLKSASTIPYPKREVATGQASQLSVGLSVEQRLYKAMARNLDRLLREMDRRHGDVTAYAAERYRWTVRNLLHFIERQLMYALRADLGWPPGGWQSLHDLFVYLMQRGKARLDGFDGIGSAETERFDPERLYRRLIAVGLVAETLGRRSLDTDLMHQVAKLADASRLVEPDGLLGEYGLILVEVARDEPARFLGGPLHERFSGWVLRCPDALRNLLAGPASAPPYPDPRLAWRDAAAARYAHPYR